MTPLAAPAPALPAAGAAGLARLDAWLAARRRPVVLALLAAAVAVRVALCLSIAGGPLPRVHAIVDESDGAFFQRWGERLAAGDWLQPAPLHPTYGWMRAAADQALALDPALPARLGVAAAEGGGRAALEERLWDAWMGGPTFYQEPAYPYLVGLTYRLLGPDPWHVYAWQLALGVLTVLLLHRIARALFSDTAALAAGALAVLAPTPPVYDVALLRDGLVIFVSVALVCLMRWAPEGGRRRWLVLGLGFGAALAVKQSFAFFPLAMAAWRLVAGRPALRTALPAAAATAAGMLLALAPVAARNLAVGAPLLGMNGSASAMLAVYHARAASPVDLVVGPEFAEVLVRAGGRLLASLAAAAGTHASAWDLARLELGKLAYAWHGYEGPNNVDPALFRQAAPFLGFLPVTMLVLVPLAGAALSARGTWRAWPLLVAIAASVPPLVLSTVLSRYRAPLLVLLVPLAGAGAVALARAAAARRWGPLAAWAAAAALFAAWASSSPPGLPASERARRDAYQGIAALARHEPAHAVLCLREASRLDPANPRIRARLGQALLLDGQNAAALREVEAAAAVFDSSALRELHARALAAAGRGPEAAAEARAAVAMDPANTAAAALLDELRRGPQRLEEAAERPPRAPEATP